MSDEERLAGQSIAIIRAWIEKRGKAKGSSSLPRLAIKFCGGCNPSVDRGLLAHMIRKKLSGEVHWRPADEEADLLLIINGCLTACADRPEVKEKAAGSLAIRGQTISEIREKGE